MARSIIARRWGLALLVAGILAATPATADRVGDRLAGLLGELPAEEIPTGVLIDRVLELAPLTDHDGTAASMPVTLRDWRQMLHQISRASLAPPSWSDLEAVTAQAQPLIDAGVIPIAIMNFRYDRIRRDALETGALVAREGRLTIGVGDAFTIGRAFAASALRDDTHRGHHIVFALDRDIYLTNDPVRPLRFEIDFDDGNGYVAAAFGERRAVRYLLSGRKVVRLRMTLADGSVQHGAFEFDVRALDTPAPDDTLHVTASIPFNGGLGTGDAYVYLAPGHAALVNPVVLLEGFDLDNSMNWDELYALLNREELIETLRLRGYDAVVLNFGDAVDFIQRNAFVAVELLAQIQGMIAPGQTVVLAGASMGGLVGRYALAYMEMNALPHAVRTFISFDSPQNGAAIPLGIQYWLWFFADQSPEAAALLAALDAPAARQMLVYHHTDPPGATGESDPLRFALAAELSALGDYPSGPRLVAIANGSGARTGQGFNPAAQLIRWEYSNWYIDLIGNVWAVPDGASATIFRGLIDIILLPPDELTVTVAGTQPYDNAPGGWRNSMAEMAATPAPYGDIIALHPNHCFIPSTSALALDTSDLFYDIAGDPDLLAHTPFDAAYFPLANEEHVAITPENAAFILAEVEGGTVAIAEPVPSVARVELATRNPIASEALIRYALPHAGPVRLSVIDVLGREVARLVDRPLTAGAGEVVWSARNAGGSRVAAGVYFVQLRGSDFSTATKVLVE